jgi:hypothetical protein
LQSLTAPAQQLCFETTKLFCRIMAENPDNIKNFDNIT